MAIVLIGGGSRSGKSRQALALARSSGSRFAFIATGEAFDAEMSTRIARHRSERGPEFTTIEEPLDLDAALNKATEFDAVVVDCLTLWLSNLMHSDWDIDEATARVLHAASRLRQAVFVTNEVGSGIVPDNALARRFRDEAGRMNQRFAEAAAEVYFMAFGCALRLR